MGYSSGRDKGRSLRIKDWRGTVRIAYRIQSSGRMRSSRRGGLRQCCEVAQNRCGAAQALLRLLPVVEQDNLHVGAHARGSPLIADEGDQAVGIGEGTVAEGDHRAFRT